MPQQPIRISIVGTTGSGKSTTAAAAASRLGIPHIELDSLFWDKNWKGVPEVLFLSRILSAVAGDAWIMDGNYSRYRNHVWKKATTVVFLDYSFHRTFWQLLQRTTRRSLKKEMLWNGCQETFRQSFLSRESILLWMLKTWRRNHKKYPGLFSRPEYAHLEIIHLHHPRETQEWLLSLGITWENALKTTPQD